MSNEKITGGKWVIFWGFFSGRGEGVEGYSAFYRV